MNKGISLVSLMITIVIIVLLTTTVTISATSSLNNSRKITFATEISFIQEAVNNYYMKNNNVPVLDKIEFNLSNLEEKNKLEFDEEKSSDNIVELYEIDLEKIGKIDNIFGKYEKENDIYAVSLNTNKVYYIAGLNAGSDKYYSLNDELKKIIRYSNSALNDGIIFNKSINKWTNQSINTKILVPDEYTDVVINVIQDENIINSVLEYSNDNGYNKYSVEKISGNYIIEVKYLKQGENKNITFKVNNFDNGIPTYKLSDKKILDNGEKKYSYIEIFDIYDELSGISKAKYIKSSASLEEIKNGGIYIQNNIIEFDESVEYITLYIEDNAGNYAYQIVDVRGE